MKSKIALISAIGAAAVVVLLVLVIQRGGDSVVEVKQEESAAPKVAVQTSKPVEQAPAAVGVPVGDRKGGAAKNNLFTASVINDQGGVPIGAEILVQPGQKVDTGITFSDKELEGVSLLPPMPLSGRWSGPNRFELRWDRPKDDMSEVALTLHSLPIGKEKSVDLVSEKKGPYTFSIPPILMNGFLVEDFQPRSHIRMQLIWNHSVDLKALDKKLRFKLFKSRNREWKTVDNDHIRIVRHSDRSQMVTISGRDLTGGEIVEIFMDGEQEIDGRKVMFVASSKLDIDVPTTIQIQNISANEGSDFFTLSVPFRISGEGVDYYKARQGRIDVATAKEFIRVTPEIEYEVVPGVGSFRLIGPFKPDTSYSVEFLAGLKGTENQWLKENVRREVKTPNFNPRLAFLTKARYLPRLDGAELPFEYRNVEQMRLSFRRVPPQNLIFWMTQNGNAATPQVSEEVLSKDMKLDMESNRKARGVIDLSDLASAGKGVFQVSLSRLYGDKNNYAAQMDSALVVVTDLAAIAKQDGDDLYVWTRSASDFSARSSVQVKVMSYNNFEIASCRTDSDGGCHLKGVMKQKKKPYALVMSTSNDLSYLRFSDVVLNNGDSQQKLRAYGDNKTALEGYIYSSRGVYRPGEKVNLASVVWSGERLAAKNAPLQWKILSPRQKVVRQLSVHSSSFGMSQLDFQLDDYADTGKYQAVLSSGDKQINSYGFFVEEFVPERIGLKVNPEKALVQADEMAKFDVDAKYLFGPPVAEGGYKARFSLKPAWFTVPGNKAFATGEYRITKQAPIMLQPQSGKLDKDGLVTLDLSVDRMKHVFPTVMSLTASVDVTESGSGRVTHQNASTLVSAHSEIIGLRNISAKDGKISVEGRLFTPSGEEVRRDAQVEVSLLEIYSNWTYSWDPERRYNTWRSEDVLLTEGKSSVIDVKNGRFDIKLNSRKSWGRYVIRVRSLETRQTSDLVVSMGYSWYWGARGGDQSKPHAPDQVRLVPSVNEAEVGEDVSISFESPFTGKALFAVEADHLIESRWVEVKKGPNTLTLETPDFLPNVYATLLIIKDPEEGEMYVPARAWGNVSLKVKPKQYLIDLKAKVPEKMRPGNDLVIKLDSSNGKKAEFTVAVVDEGILQLTRFNTPKPIDYFFEPRRLGVSTYETIGWTFPRTMKSGRGLIGGGVAAQKQKKSGRIMPVRLVSHWSGVVTSDATGKAEVRVPIPPFQGKVRVMVVAAQDGKVGHQEHFVTVRDPLVMQPTLPRFLQWGDHFDIPVFLVNMTGKEQQVTTTVSAGSSVKLEKEKLSATIPDMGSATLLFPARVAAFDGKASFSFKAKAEGIETIDSAQLPIHPMSPEKRVNVTLEAGKHFTIAEFLPDDLRDEGLKVEIAASAIPYISELKRLRYLIHYPYGCIEQTTSSTMPLLYIGDVMSVVDPDALKDKNIKDMVYSGINRLLSMQTISGGFAYWPGGSEPVLWGTAYATHLLVKAKELGYDVPQSALNDALKFMEEALTSRRYQWNKSHYYYGDSEPYMAFVLGLAGRHQKATLRRLINSSNWSGGKRIENRFLLMLAAHMAGESQLVKEVTGKDDLFSAVDLGDRDYTGSYWSAYRTDAMRLSLAEDVWPGDPKLDALTRVVAKRLSTVPYLNTQESAWSVSALGKMASRFKGASVEGLTLLVDGESQLPETTEKGIPAWRFYGSQLPTGKKLELKFKGEKPPFLYASISGYKKSLKSPESTTRAFELKREYLTLDGGVADPLKIKQGELMVVKLSMKNETSRVIENVAVSDRLPAGFEVENPNLGRSDEMAWIDESTMFKPAYVDRRDDRVDFFGDLNPSHISKWLNYYYIVRAVSNGRFTASPSRIEAMYEPEKHAYSGYEKIEISSP